MKDDQELFDTIHKNLHVNMEIKNYKNLCNILNIKEKNGKSKKIQLENLERFFLYEKNGHKFTITKLFDEPIKQKKDRRFNPDNDALTLYIENILLLNFIEKDQISFTYTKNELWKKLGMINQYYSEYYLQRKIDMTKFKFVFGYKNWEVKHFFDRTRDILVKKTNMALKRLQNKKIIKYQLIYYASTENGHIEILDESKISKILEIERKTIDSMIGDYQIIDGKKIRTSITDIIYSKESKNNYENYKKKLNINLKNELGYDYVYQRYKIICVRKELLEKEVEFNYKELQKMVNDKMITFSNEQVENNKEKYKNYKNYAFIQEKLTKQFLQLDYNLQKEFYKKERMLLEEKNKLNIDNEELESLFSSKNN